MTSEPTTQERVDLRRTVDNNISMAATLRGWDAEELRLHYLRTATEAQEKIVELHNTWKEALEPCKLCGRKVPSACDTVGGMMECGPWDFACEGFKNRGR